jgi:hypothetical protein
MRTRTSRRTGTRTRTRTRTRIQMRKTRRPTVVHRASKVRGIRKVVKTFTSSAKRGLSIIRRMEINPWKASTMLLVRKKPTPQPFQQSSSRLSLSSSLFLPQFPKTGNSRHVMSLDRCCCSTVVRCKSLGSESTMYTVNIGAPDMRIESILVEYWRNFEWFGRGLNRLFGCFLQ